MCSTRGSSSTRHRQLSHNGGRVLKRKVSATQRKHLLKVGIIYPDAVDALKISQGKRVGDSKLNDLEVEGALAMEEIALGDIAEASNDEDDDGEED